MTNSAAGAPATKPRASGRVQIWSGARVVLTSVRLDQIRGAQPSIGERNTRLDLAMASNVDLERWDPSAIELLMLAAPPWVCVRGPESPPQYLLLAGGQFLPGLRRLLPPDASVPALVVDSKFQPARILQLAAAHAAAMTAAAGSLSFESVARILDDAAAHGAPVLRRSDSAGGHRAALGLPASTR